MFSVNIKTGTRLKSKATGAIITVIDMDFNTYEWVYVIEVAGIRKSLSYNSILKEYDLMEDNSPSHISETTCVCGGMKTYNSRDSVYHSVWCIYGK